MGLLFIRTSGIVVLPKAARMTDAACDNHGQEGHNDQAAVEAFVAQMTEAQRMLIILQSELYEGSWQPMLTDLRNRLEGKPYIFKLANRINDDIERIEELQAFEEKHQVKLSDFVKPPRP